MNHATPPVTGPHRIYVESTPTGAALDVEHWLTSIITALATDDEVAEAFADVTDALSQTRVHDPYGPELLPMERLLSLLGTRIHLYGADVTTLTDRLQRTIRPLAAAPALQDRRAS